MALLRTLPRAAAVGILLGLALFGVEFLISVRFYFRDIVSWSQASGVFVGLALVYAAVGAAVGLIAAFVVRPPVLWLRVFLVFQGFFLLVILLGYGRFPLPTWCYPAYVVAADLLALGVWAAFRPLQRAAPRLASGLFWGSSYGLLVGMGSLGLYSARPQLPAGPPAPATAERPNVVLIVLDTVRADHLSVYGYDRETTPNLAAFAKEATVYERAYAPAPWTVPSHASLFTGKLPGDHGAHQEHFELAEQEETLAEHFQAAGYQTAAIVNNPFLSPRLGFSQGFNRFDENWSHLLRRHGFILTAALARFLPAGEDHGAHESIEAARRFIHGSRDRRFFLFLNLMEAHAPYGTIPAPLRTRFRTGPPPERFGYWMDAALPEVVTGQRTLSVEERQTITDLYDAGIFYLDRMVEELLNTLRREGLSERTVFAITSDHGEHLGDHDLVSHFFSLYDPLLHVPLILRAPGRLPPGQRVREPVRTQDLFATLLDAAGISPPPRRFSSSLFAPPTERLVVSEAYRPWFMMRRLSLVIGHEELARLDRRRRAIRRGSHKLVWVEDAPPALYDVSSDPEERHDLAGERPEQVRTLGAELEAIVEDFPAREGQFPGFDPVSLQRLRSLGYVH